MGLNAAIRSHPLVFLFGLAVISLLGLLFVPPIPQPQDYHQFADQKTLLGIPNFWNVVSNLPFIAVGALGLQYFRRDLSAGVFFLGVFLTGFSSSYYNWNPNDAGLFWDRLPMAVAFMAILANVVEERIDATVGKLLLWPLVLLGIASLLWWMRTDDLRLYGWVQFFPCLVLPLTFWLFAPKYSGTWYWLAPPAGTCSPRCWSTPTRPSMRPASTSWPATRSSISPRPAPVTRSCARFRPGSRSSIE